MEKPKRRRPSFGNDKMINPNVAGGGMDGHPPETTGKYLVLLRRDAVQEGVKALNNIAGVKNIARTSDFEEGAISGEKMAGAESIVFDKLAVAVVDAPPDQIQRLGVAAASGESAILAVEEERVVYALQKLKARTAEPATPLYAPPMPVPLTALRPEVALPVEYLRGYRDAVDRLVDKLLAPSGMADAIGEAEALKPTFIEDEATWGLQATKVVTSRFSGKGVRIAVLDTGLDLQHPDFAGRQITSRSFVEDSESLDGQDGHGHGTHVIGTACGPLQPKRLPRYGIAYDAEIFAGKVLNDEGSGADSGILAGIEWALTNDCQIVSMSLGAPVRWFTPFSKIFEEVARRALEQGALIIAAAGNESRRPFLLSPVGHPANCPSIMAVGAVDSEMNLGWFSNRSSNTQGGRIDIVAPGVEVYSSSISPHLYNTLNGTSMATPHVSGIAALYAEANPEMRGRALMSLLIQNARRLEAPGTDVGAGLVQAP